MDHLEGAGCAGKLTASLKITTVQDDGTHGGSPGRSGCAGKITASLNIVTAQDGGTHGGSPGRSELPTSPLLLQPSFGYSGHFSRNLRRFSFLLSNHYLVTVSFVKWRKFGIGIG